MSVGLEDQVILSYTDLISKQITTETKLQIKIKANLTICLTTETEV